MENQNQQVSGKPGLFRRLFGWRMVRRYLFALLCLVTLVLLLFAEENWRGRRAWDNYKQELEAKGEKLDLPSFVPPPVPDDQNFAMTPLLAPLFDFNPRPLQPGQSLWRDTNAYNRLENLASNLFSSRASDPQRRFHDYQNSDFDVYLQALSAKTLPADSPFKSKPEAASAALEALENYRPAMDEIQTASRRPYSRFNISYGDADPAAILLPHLTVVRHLALLFELRANAELALGQGDPALADVKMVLYLAGTIKTEPIIISGLVRIAILNMAVTQIRAGLDAHVWTDAQIAEVEADLAGYDLLAEYERVIRGERAFSNGIFEYLMHGGKTGDIFDGPQPPPVAFFPRGWLYQNRVVINRLHQEYTLPLVDAASHRVHPDQVSELGNAMNTDLYSGFTPYKIFARMLMPALNKLVSKYAFQQVRVDEAVIACALERYHLVKGEYPETLAALQPQFIATLPNDIFTGEPLKYHRTDDGKFMLYSVGWNGTDDGGKVVMSKGATPHMDQTQGDWVWGVD